MIFVYNDGALFSGVIGVACGLPVWGLSGSESAGMIVGALCASGFDLATRVKYGDEGNPLLMPNAGGHIWFLPMWLIGAVVAVVGVLMWMKWI